MTISRYDHTAVPVENVDRMLAFYNSLGFSVHLYSQDGKSLWTAQAGDVRINFHAPEAWQSDASRLCASNPVPGSAELCFAWSGTLETLTSFLLGLHLIPVAGPVERNGGANEGRAIGQSVYIHDPDGNLLEFIVYS